MRYELAPDLTPGEIGALVDESVDLAIKGYLRIRVDQKDLLFGLFNKEETWFERSDRLWNDLRDYERKVFAGIFASGSVVSTEDPEEKFYKQIQGIRDALWADLANRRSGERSTDMLPISSMTARYFPKKTATIAIAATMLPGPI